MSFLPDGYEVPSTEGNYMKFKKGENKFRILSSPIIGFEYWIEEGGKKKPIRKRSNEDIVLAEVPEPDKIRHFWAMVVFDHSDEKVKILEVTQKIVLKALTALAKDEDWGDPKGDKGYDIVVTREGEDLQTSYSVSPKPRKPLKDGVMELYKNMNINLDGLFDGKDPFQTAEEEVDVDEIFLKSK